MMCRRLLLGVAIGLSALGALPGCGMAVRKTAAEPLLQVGTVTRNYRESSQRVALAAFEAMRAELASADFAGDSEFSASSAESGLESYPGRKPRPGDPLPPNYPAFWIEWTHKGRPIEGGLVTLRACRFAGKARDGRAVRVSVLAAPEGSMATVHVGKHGDPELSRALLDRLADRLAHPLHPPGSAEEAATFRAFFGGVESREAIPTLRKPDAKAAR